MSTTTDAEEIAEGARVLSELLERNKDLQSQLDLAKSTMNFMSMTLTSNTETLTDVRKERDEARDERDKARSDLEKARKDLSALEEEKDDLQDRLDTAKADISARAKAQATMRDRLIRSGDHIYQEDDEPMQMADNDDGPEVCNDLQMYDELESLTPTEDNKDHIVQVIVAQDDPPTPQQLQLLLGVTKYSMLLASNGDTTYRWLKDDLRREELQGRINKELIPIGNHKNLRLITLSNLLFPQKVIPNAILDKFKPEHRATYLRQLEEKKRAEAAMATTAAL